MNRNVKNSKEIKFIKNQIMENVSCLTPLLSDFDEIDMDDLESIVFNLTNNDIEIISILKSIKSYRRKDYYIRMNINNLINNVGNWFTYDSYLDVFEDAEVYIDIYT